MRVSDVIRRLQGQHYSRFLCNVVFEWGAEAEERGDAALARACEDAEDAIQSFVRTATKYPYESCLLNVFREFAWEDGYAGPLEGSGKLYLEARDKFCRDYADFLAGFGL